MNGTKKQKKTPVLKRLLPYAGKKSYMLPLAILFSALSGIMMLLMPMVYIHEIVSRIILSNSIDGVSIRHDAILAASFAAAGMLLYFFALMVSHFFAFEVEANIIKLNVKKMMAKSLGFLLTAKAVIVIAHRIRTIRGADKIVLLSQGKIEAMGTDAELQMQSVTYRKMLEKSIG